MSSSSDKKQSDQYSDEETKRRAEEALRGAFKTPPQPLEKKDKPKGDEKRN